MSHYETLGIQPDADPDEVKRAYRRKSQKVHPDRGGSDAEQAAVNRAYEVVSDPTRREEYDRTGEDGTAQSVYEEAREVVLKLFAHALDQGAANPVLFARQMLMSHVSGFEGQRARLLSNRGRLVLRAGKVRVKSGVNLMEMLIAEKIKAIEADLQRVSRASEVNAASLEILRQYECDEAEQRGWFTTGMEAA